jgi:hypothetical protein
MQLAVSAEHTFCTFILTYLGLASFSLLCRMIGLSCWHFWQGGSRQNLLYDSCYHVQLLNAVLYLHSTLIGSKSVAYQELCTVLSVLVSYHSSLIIVFLTLVSGSSSCHWLT